MRYLLIILFISCGTVPKIEYVSSGTSSGNNNVLITCIDCPAVITKTCDLTIYGDEDVKLGGQLIKDTSIEFLILRLKEVNDSIVLIKKETAWLDSVGHTMDTVKWTPYYYKKPKKQ